MHVQTLAWYVIIHLGNYVIVLARAIESEVLHLPHKKDSFHRGWAQIDAGSKMTETKWRSAFLLRQTGYISSALEKMW